LPKINGFGLVRERHPELVLMDAQLPADITKSMVRPTENRQEFTTIEHQLQLNPAAPTMP
jgi:hypothetical protein